MNLALFLRRLTIGCFVAVPLLTGCATIHVVGVNKELTMVDKGGPDGYIYYLPKPYLLIAEVPPDETAAAPDKLSLTDELERNGRPNRCTDDNGNYVLCTPPARVMPKNRRQFADHTAAPSADKSKDPKSGDDSSSSTSPASASDTSFGLATKQYQIKLIYLPDQAHPRLIEPRAGLFGSVEVKPTLVDGWMLTSIDSSSDTKVAEVLTSLASFAKAGGSDAKGSTGKKGDATGADAALELMRYAGSAAHPPVLPPGLYEIDTSGSIARAASKTAIPGVFAVTYFCEDGPRPAAEGNCPQSKGTK